MRDGNDEVYLLVGRTADLHGEIDTRARRITTTEAESVGAYLAWNAGRVGLAWSDKIRGRTRSTSSRSIAPACPWVP